MHVVYGTSAGLSASGDQFVNQGTPGIAGDPEINDYFGGSLVGSSFLFLDD